MTYLNKTFGRGEGFSLRDSLIRQGVTTNEGIKFHTSFVGKMLAINPNFDLTRYRVSKSNPNTEIDNS